MSSTQQLFHEGQARGQGEEKASQWVDSAKDVANTARDKVSSGAQHAQDSLSDTANAACDRLSSNSQSAQENKEQAAGFLQQTGEQVMHMAQGAADAVKNAVGIDGHSHGGSTTSH